MMHPRYFGLPSLTFWFDLRSSSTNHVFGLNCRWFSIRLRAPWNVSPFSERYGCKKAYSLGFGWRVSFGKGWRE